MTVSRTPRHVEMPRHASGRWPGQLPLLLLGALASLAVLTPTTVAVTGSSDSRHNGRSTLIHAGSSGPATVAPSVHPRDSAATGNSDPLPAGWVGTRFGPLSPADRDAVTRVRLAGLWEAPAGAQARERGLSPKVREVGGHLASEHTTLDATVRSIAGQLGIELPNEPTPEQQGWLAELARSQGAQFDQVFVDRLRKAHGTVFPLISQVRASTRNSLVRSFAQNAVDIVMRHMTLLESTGLVRYDQLPTPPSPLASMAGKSKSSPSGTLRSLGVAWLVLVGIFALGARYLLRSFRTS